MIILRAIITKKARGSPIPGNLKLLNKKELSGIDTLFFQFQNLGSVWSCTKGYPESQDFSEYSLETQ